MMSLLAVSCPSPGTQAMTSQIVRRLTSRCSGPQPPLPHTRPPSGGMRPLNSSVRHLNASRWSAPPGSSVGVCGNPGSPCRASSCSRPCSLCGGRSRVACCKGGRLVFRRATPGGASRRRYRVPLFRSCRLRLQDLVFAESRLGLQRAWCPVGWSCLVQPTRPWVTRRRRMIQMCALRRCLGDGVIQCRHA